MSQKSATTIVVKRPKKVEHGHHGGAWKVAYADFVTAMMAFFLLLWLLNAATKEQLRGISDYFAPISSKSSTSGGRGLLAGRTVAKVGVFQDETPRSRVDPAEGEPSPAGSVDTDEQTPPPDVTEAEMDEFLRKREERQFQAAENQLRDAIAGIPDMQDLGKSLLIDNTTEGLRIQIIDQEGLPMFPRGDAAMYAHTRRMLELVATVVQKMPQDVDITGHTDATRYVGGAGYSNWELSADRANAARRALVQFGVPEKRIARVVGKAATDPLITSDPEAPGNRRLSLVMLRGTGGDRSGAKRGGGGTGGVSTFVQ
ncbi:MAG TPA: flagellar motor protein MotB [Rhodospirillales bacterium]|nr:flagellar motor protein MotB [Rhodospirillales bacterium]